MQVSPFPVAHDTNAEKAGDDHDNDHDHPPEAEQLDVEVVSTETTERPVKLTVDAEPWVYPQCDVQDVFCPDQQYRQQSHQPQPHSPSIQCNDCDCSILVIFMRLTAYFLIFLRTPKLTVC